VFDKQSQFSTIESHRLVELEGPTSALTHESRSNIDSGELASYTLPWKVMSSIISPQRQSDT